MVDMVDIKLRPMEIVNVDATTDADKYLRLYLITDYKLEEGQHISQRYSPYLGRNSSSGGGTTQNLGRMPISLSLNLRLVDYKVGSRSFSKEYMLGKLMDFKRDRQKMSITLASINAYDAGLTSITQSYLDKLLLSGVFHIGAVTMAFDAPTYTDVTVTFHEDLKSNLKQNRINLVANALGDKLAKYINQIYGV